MSINTQKMICEAFGYKSPLGVNIMTSSEKQATSIQLIDDNTEICAMCGQVHNVGYKSSIGAENLLKTLISDTYNECYSIKAINFICEYCGYSLKAYGSPSKSAYGKKMINVLVHDGKAIEKSFNSDAKNELYDILLNVPKPPFVIMINSRGTVLENMVFSSRASVSSGLVVVNYGMNQLEVSPSEVFSCIEDVIFISQKYNLEVNAESIWNRMDEVTYKEGKDKNGKKIDLDGFYTDMGIFLTKYDRDCRIVGKMILLAYLADNKNSKKNSDKVSDYIGGNNIAEQPKSLFDF